VQNGMVHLLKMLSVMLVPELELDRSYQIGR
jgi:hypothetical protein